MVPNMTDEQMAHKLQEAEQRVRAKLDLVCRIGLKLKRDRDALLEACRDILNQIECHERHEQREHFDIDKLKHVIAEAERE